MKNIKIFTGRDNEILRAISEKVSFVEAKKIIAMLKIGVNSKPALGIAAPQIGINKRIILTKIGKSFIAMINPEILEKSDNTAIAEEGCLSLPEVWGNVQRSIEIVVEFVDEKNSPKKLRLKDLDARVVQHEFDHLNGVLFVDKLISHGVVL